jgi:hypothetical protein
LLGLECGTQQELNLGWKLADLLKMCRAAAVSVHAGCMKTASVGVAAALAECTPQAPTVSMSLGSYSGMVTAVQQQLHASDHGEPQTTPGVIHGSAVILCHVGDIDRRAGNALPSALQCVTHPRKRVCIFRRGLTSGFPV